MALSRFVLPYADVGAGIRPSSGAKLFFYATGTSTFKSTFTDSTGSTANTNPVIANANGVFPAIFLSGIFNVALKDANDVQIWTADPVYSSGLTFDTVAAMKTASAPVGQLVTTKGYYVAGDGGGATYFIVAAQAFDGYGDHQLSGGNIAVIQNTFKNVLMFGAVIGSTDSGLAMQAYLNYDLELNFPTGTFSTSIELLATSTGQVLNGAHAMSESNGSTEHGTLIRALAVMDSVIKFSGESSSLHGINLDGADLAVKVLDVTTDCYSFTTTNSTARRGTSYEAYILGNRANMHNLRLYGVFPLYCKSTDVQLSDSRIIATGNVVATFDASGLQLSHNHFTGIGAGTDGTTITGSQIVGTGNIFDGNGSGPQLKLKSTTDTDVFNVDIQGGMFYQLDQLTADDTFPAIEIENNGSGAVSRVNIDTGFISTGSNSYSYLVEYPAATGDVVTMRLQGVARGYTAICNKAPLLVNILDGAAGESRSSFGGGKYLSFKSQSGIFKASFSCAANTTTAFTLAFTGASVGDSVSVSALNALGTGLGFASCRVSSANVIEVTLINATGSSVASGNNTYLICLENYSLT